MVNPGMLLFDNCDALKDFGQIKQTHIKLCVTCFKFLAALDRLNLNLVRTVPINQLRSLTAVPSVCPSPSEISSVVTEQ